MKYITIKNEKIDLLQLIPDKTESGYKIEKERFIKNSEEWIRCYYVHPRNPELKLRRFVDTKEFGGLLGQMQAEGTKVGKRFKVDFPNKLVQEHVDFVRGLESIGVGRIKLEFRLMDSENTSDAVLDEYAKRFEKAIGVYPKISRSPSMRGGMAFRTVFRNTILTEIILNSLDLVRKQMANDASTIMTIADAFFAKHLTGDGTIDVDKRVPPRVAVRVVDASHEYLEDYERIFKNLGFKWTNLRLDMMAVKACCSFENLLYLHHIKAFRNTNNWNKLLVAIGLVLKGRRLRTLLRFSDLETLGTFTSLDVKDRYDVRLRSANCWLKNAIKHGYMRRVTDASPYEYKLTEQAIRLNRTLGECSKELNQLISVSKINSLPALLESLKTKKRSSK